MLLGGDLEPVHGHVASGFDVDEPITQPVTLCTEVINLALGGIRQLVDSATAPGRQMLKHPGFDAHLICVTGLLPDLVLSVVRDGNAHIRSSRYHGPLGAR